MVSHIFSKEYSCCFVKNKLKGAYKIFETLKRRHQVANGTYVHGAQRSGEGWSYKFVSHFDLPRVPTKIIKI